MRKTIPLAILLLASTTSIASADVPAQDLGTTETARPHTGPPTLALEVAMTSGRLADPYVVDRGYTFENGQAIGTRVEANLVGISLSYELARLSNTQACTADTCFSGDFGATTIHTLELGYRLRFSRIGIVRPFLHVGLGGVLASVGDWSMTTTDKTIKGGEARAAVGIEIPFADRFFGSASLGYRFLVTENPLRNEDVERADKVFIDAAAPTAGNYAEDAHLITGYLGIGVTL